MAAAVVFPFLLSACGGGEDEDVAESSSASSGGSSAAASTGPTLTDSQVLLTSFLSSLDVVRSSATALLTTDVRYMLQTASSSYYKDINENGQFDENVDVRLEGNPLEHAGVHYAHAAGLTGQGEVIAFSDDGFNTDHETFSGKSIAQGTGLANLNHGTFVASVATGNSNTMIGVAPQANAIFGSFDTMAQLAETADAARAAGAVALNNSWGFANQSASQSDYNALFGSTGGGQYLSALRSYAEDGIVIFAVSNDYNLATAGLMSGLPALEPDLERSWLAVINGMPQMVGDDVVSARRVSGACLNAAAWCLAANGSWTGANATSNSSYNFGTGSSFAAPMVAGALALLAEAFPDLSHQELRVRLLASADNDFAEFTADGTVELVPGFEHAYSNEWGHGFLDVAAALLPIGQPTVQTGNGTVLNMDAPLVVAGGASGDAVARSLQNVDIVSRDALSASFQVDAAQMVAQRSTTPLFSIHDVTSYERFHAPSLGGTAFFGTGRGLPVMLGDDNLSFTLFHGEDGGNDALGFGVSRGFDLGGADLTVSTTYGDDTAELLSDWNGGTNASLFSVDMTLSTALTAASQVGFELGYAYGQEASGLGQSADVLLTAASVSYARQHAFAHNDRVKVSLSLPAAVSSGGTSVSLPVAGGFGQTTYQDVPIDLSPNSREVRFGLHYERPLGKTTSLGISLAHAQNRGHVAGARETAVMIGFNARF